MTVGALLSALFGPSGYSRATRDILFGLNDLGVDIRIVGMAKPNYDGVTSQENYARLKLFAQNQREPDIYINISGQFHFWRVSDKPTVGLSMWEGRGQPPHFVSACELVNEVWVPGLLDFDDFQTITKVPRNKLALMPLGVDTELYSPGESIFQIESSEGDLYDFIFGIVCGYSARKGMDLLERAYFESFTKEDVTALLIKAGAHASHVLGQDLVTARGDLPIESLPTILYHCDMVADREMPELFRVMDCFVFPSRGEGQGLPPLEAMAVGLPTIVTDATALADFAFPEICYPISSDGWSNDSRTHWITSAYKNVLFASPNYEQLKSAMRLVFDNRKEARARGEKARDFMEHNRDCSILARRMRDRLEQILSGKGGTEDFGPESLPDCCPNVAFDGTRFRYKERA